MSEFTRVKLTPEETIARAQELAQRIRDRELLEEEHKEQREDMKAEAKQLDKAIKRLAAAVRTGSEDQERQVGLFP
jgi:hypothetical protein